MKHYSLLFLFAVLLLASCDIANDPKRLAVQIEAQGRADRMAELTVEDVAAMAQARALEYEREQIAIREQDIRQSELTRVGSVVLPFLGVAVIILAVGLSSAIAVAALGASVASSARAITSSFKIYPDHNGNYPLLTIPKATPIMLVNPNHHSSLDTAKEHTPKPQLVTGDYYLRATAVLADKTKSSHNNGPEVSIIRPALIEAQKVTAVEVEK